MTQPAQGIIAHLVVSDAAEALDFYARALGATETMRMPAEDKRRIMHAEIEVNSARLFLRDHFPEFCPANEAAKLAPPPIIGGTTVTLHLEVPNCDAAVARMKEAGGTVLMEPMDAFWGARYAQLLDPFGHCWSFAHPLPGAPR